jgi:hypothetical protein
MNQVTRIISAIEHGDPAAAERLLPVVYALPTDESSSRSDAQAVLKRVSNNRLTV